MINKDLKVAVLGAGAMGCLFGGLLAEKGLNVILIDVWKEHIEAINKNGLKMDGHGGDRFIKVKATNEPSKLDIVDAVIVMCKATALEPALNSIKNIIGEKTIFMSFQNGIGHEAIMQKIVGKEKVIGGTTTQASNILGPGHIKNHAALPSWIGEYEGGVTDRVKGINLTTKNAKRILKWKIDKKIVGSSAVLNEIGSHAYHLAIYISGLKGVKIFADIKNFSKKIKGDANAQAMVNFNNEAKGMFWISSVPRGGVYGLKIRVFGSKGSLEWAQNNPGYLRFNPAKGAVRLLEKGFFEADFSKKFTRVKYGHPEGYLDAFANIYKEFAKSLTAKSKKRHFYPNEDEGLETAKFIEACKISSKRKKWVKI